MYQQEKPAYIMSQVACALIRMEGMKADNLLRPNRGEYPQYGQDDFDSLIAEFQIGHNDVIKLLQG